MTLKKLALTAALLATSLLANAHEYDVGQLHIDHPWSREMPPVAPVSYTHLTLPTNREV